MQTTQTGPSGGAPLFHFILQPEFPLNALILASDALRIANQNSGRALFAWRFLSESGEPVRASNGMWFHVDGALDQAPLGDVCLVFEGNLPTQRNSPRLLQHLRSAARFGAIVGGIDTGAFALAQAGLIGSGNRPEVVVHWEARQTFEERFPTAHMHDQLYLVAEGRAHAAGGVAALDLLLDLVARYQGEALANEVANALVHSRRPADASQRSDTEARDAGGTLMRRLVDLMESRLDFPLTLEELAEQLGVSARSLSRRCQHSFAEPPMRLYLRIRLQAARNLLFYEEFSIKDVALACGFSYPSVFARAFRAQFGTTPRGFRAAFRASQSQSVRPELRRMIGPRSENADGFDGVSDVSTHRTDLGV